MLISADGGSWRPLARLPEPPPSAPAPATTPTIAPPVADYRPDTTYHPQVGPSGSGGVQVLPQGNPGSCAPTGIPSPTDFSAGVRGPQAREFDVVLSQLATAVYENRPAPPPGWSAVTDQALQDAGIADPAAWRAQYLHGGDELLSQNFHAEIYTDCNGNYVLSYRGTDGTPEDWMNNGRQGVGLQTEDDADKFSDLAADTAVEFERVFGALGADGEATNLAITGHSQGGGLASAGSLASGIPAVTFDASGLHPNTLERMGFTPEEARAMAEDGLIRRYSLQDDALTQLQESSPLALAAPDALGTQVVVQASGVQDLTLIGRGLDIETGLPSVVVHGLGALLEGADRLNVPLVGGVGSLARNLVSHSPELLTDAMIQQRPWEAGYVNPQDGGR
ncbi:MAG TPA: hypothetical protein VLK29_06840, partial [Luteimonas sp.]|nr:hypothetical protein [Luteimonas sp.]